VDTYIQKLHVTIDHAMALSYRRNPHDPRNNMYVARITLCKGVPFYGFHVGWKFFLKIYLLNPACMQRLGDLFRNGSILGKAMQPYEIHIPYLLQFMADYGLYGCGWVSCSSVIFRAPVPRESLEDNTEDFKFSDLTIPGHLIITSDTRPRLSFCALEIDLRCQDILNRKSIKPRLLHYDFIERRHPPPLEEKLVHSMAELWQDEEKRRADRGENAPLSMYTSRFPSNEEAKGPWIHESEMRRKLDEAIRAERAKGDGRMLNFDTFVKQSKFSSMVQTALESVTDMFVGMDPELGFKEGDYVGLGTSSGHIRENSGDFPSAEVNEARILAMLQDLDEGTAMHGNGLDDISASDRSLSDVDFDADLLSRLPKELSEVHRNQEDNAGSEYRRLLSFPL
jgi:DNA polymerase zeta